MTMDWKWLFFAMDGRINRAKWWLAAIVLFVIVLGIGNPVLRLLGIGQLTIGAKPGVSVASLILVLIFAYPWTAAMVKRLHDRNRPIWLVAVFGTPMVASLLAKLTGTMAYQGLILTPFGQVIIVVTLVIMLWMIIELGSLKGTRGPNEHGADPLGET
jgi:uncharacterized membrane protein YhaH (DUF805 family)